MPVPKRKRSRARRDKEKLIGGLHLQPSVHAHSVRHQAPFTRYVERAVFIKVER